MDPEYSTHKKGDPLYGDPNLRKCAGCRTSSTRSGFYDLSQFKKHRRDPELYTVLCRKCLEKERKLEVEEDAAKSATTLATALKRELKERKKNGHSFGEVLSTTCAAMGGHEQAFGLTGKMLKKALELGLKDDALVSDKDRGVRAASTLLQSAALAEKSKSDIDLSDLTEDELRDILMEPARQLILSDATFRKQLVNDESVRRLLLSDVGVELVGSDE